MSRLPTPGSDSGTWGTILNDYLSQSLQPDGTLKPIAISKVTGLQSALDASYTAGGTDVAITDGGTGASTAPQALVNLGAQPVGIPIPYWDVGGNTKTPMVPGVIGMGANSATSLTANLITYHPIFLNRTMTLDEMWLEITTQQVASHVKVAIYASDGDMQPGALIKDCGIADASSTGIKKLTGLNTVMAAGVYLMARVTDVTNVGVRHVPSQYAMGSLVNPLLGATPWGRMERNVGSYATFPLDPGTPWDTINGSGSSGMALSTFPVWSS